MYEKKEKKKKELELTSELMYRLYPERFKDDVSSDSEAEVKTLTKEELKSEKILKREVAYYDSESNSYK